MADMAKSADRAESSRNFSGVPSMSRVNVVAFVLLIAVVAFWLGLQGASRERAEAQVAGKGQQWEYKVVASKSVGASNEATDAKVAERWEAYLNKLGQDGWEYVGGSPAPGLHVILKRPK
jgi:hypothetical protein